MPDTGTRAVLVLAALLTLSVSACAAGSSNRRAEHNDGWWSRTVGEGARKLLVRYRAGALEAPWTPAKDFTADFSFYNSALGATIYGDTSCGKRYEDAPLTVLINHLVLGFTDVATVSQQERELAARGAMERVATGSLDGVAVSLALTVLRKGPCVFDLVLISPPDGFDSSLTDYRAFVDGFEARVLRDSDPRRARARRGP